MSTAPQNPTRFTRLVDRVYDRFTDPEPHSLMTQLELSNIQCDIDEAKAKLDRMQNLEQAYRDVLVAMYASLAFHAGQCRNRLETRQWLQVPSEPTITLAKLETDLIDATTTHDDMVDAIAEQNTAIRELRAKFDAKAVR